MKVLVHDREDGKEYVLDTDSLWDMKNDQCPASCFYEEYLDMIAEIARLKGEVK